MTSPSSSNLPQRYPDRSSFDIREENLIAIGADVRRETGNDVFKTDPQLNEWMQRVRKLGGSADLDDDERSKRLEEEIAAQRKARQERRAERKRSLSPLKDSPRSIASGPRSPAHFLKDSKDDDEPSPAAAISRFSEREDSPNRGKDESRIDRDKVGSMLLTKNAEFFRQKEKSVGFIKSTDGGDGGYSGRNGSASPPMALPGMSSVRPTKEKTFLSIIQQQDMPFEASNDKAEGSSPYSTVSRFAASKSSPSLASGLQDDYSLKRTESLPSNTEKEDISTSAKPSMPWMMPSSTRGAGGFVASAALKRSSTLVRPTPTPETSDIRTRPATMYARTGHQRNFAGSEASISSSFNPSKHKPTHSETIQSQTSLDDESEKEIDEDVAPTPPPHKTPPLSQPSSFSSPPAQSEPSPPVENPEPSPSPVTSPKTPPATKQEQPTPRLTPSISTGSLTRTDSFSRKRWSPTKSSWLDSALQKSADPTPGSPPKRTSSIRPIPPAQPKQWGNEPTRPIVKSTSFTSAIGGMGGRRDVTGIKPISSSNTVTTETTSLGASAIGATTTSGGNVESRLAALERKAKVTPSPPSTTTKPRYEAQAARANLKSSSSSQTNRSGRDFSDPFKAGIQSTRQNLRVQDQPRENKKDEFKESIMNARKGLKRTTSGGEPSQRGVGSKEPSPVPSDVLRRTTSAPKGSVKMEDTPVPVAKKEREVTPLIELDDVVVKEEEVTPKKSLLLEKSPTPISPKPSVLTPTKRESPTQTPTSTKTEVTSKPVLSPKPTIISPKVSAVAPKSAEARTQTATRFSPAKIATVPDVKKKELDPTPQSVRYSSRFDSVRANNDSPTPNKKFELPGTPKSADTASSEIPSKLPAQDNAKQTSVHVISPTASTSVKDTIASRFNPALASMLSKGPPVMGGSRPTPVKSLSAPGPSSKSMIEEDIDTGKELTHLTKGRARGPKKRNSAKHSETEKSNELSFPRESQPPQPSQPQSKQMLSKPQPQIQSKSQPKPQVEAKPQMQTFKKPIIFKEELEPPPPPPQSSIWPKPARPLITTTSESGKPTLTTSPEKLFQPTFPVTPEPATRRSTTVIPNREREKSLSPSGSMKQRLAELSPIRRETLNLIGNYLLRPSSQPSKPKYPTLEVIPAASPAKLVDKERLFVQAWSIVSRVKHVSLPNTEEYILYESDMHAFLYMFNEGAGASEPSAIKFLWVGKDCKLGEREGMEFVRLMGDPNADTQIIQEGSETPLFIRALGGIIVTRKGTRRALDSVEDELFCVRQCLGGISIDQVDFKKSEFCSGFSYVVKRDGDVFVWHGNGSLSEEIAAARRFAGTLGDKVKEMMEADPTGSGELWKIFDEGEYASGEFWRRKYELSGFSPTLYQVEGKKARQTSPFSSEGILSSAISVVDGDFVLYVVIPPQAPRGKQDVGAALQFAKDLSERAEPSSAAFVISSESSAPHDLRAMFRHWKGHAWPFKGSRANLVSLDDAFDMLERETYRIKELQSSNLPLGVDPERLEYFLSDEEFELVMGMSKIKYDSLPPRQKSDIRESGLGLMKELRV